MIIAVGRLCIDEYYVIKNSNNRIGATKLSVEYYSQRLGGSIYNTLKTISGWDIFTWFLSITTNDDKIFHELEKYGIRLFSIIRDDIVRSMIIVEDDCVKSIFSVNETSAQQITEAETRRFLSMIEPYVTRNDIFILDLRQRDADIEIAQYAQRKGGFIILDPGSTAFETNGKYIQQYRSIISMCNMVVASSEFYYMHSRLSKLSDYLALPEFANADILVCTLSNGANIISTKCFCFTIARNEPITIGNTMCAGDVFRGSLIANMHQSKNKIKDISKDFLISIMKCAIAAATIKIEDKDIIPRIPKKSEIEDKAKKMVFKISDIDIMEWEKTNG